MKQPRHFVGWLCRGIWSRTSWDWLTIVILGLVALGFAYWQDERANEREDRRAESNRQFEVERSRDAVFVSYLDQVTTILLQQNPPFSESDSRATSNTLFIGPLTETVFPQLDDRRKLLLNDLLFRLYQREQLTEEILQSIDLRRIDFSALGESFQSIGLVSRGVDLSYSRMVDMGTIFVSIPDSVFQWAEIRGTRFENSTFTGVRLTQSELGDVTFYDTNLDFSELNQSELSNVTFHVIGGSRMTFHSAKLFNVEFFETNLTQASFRGATLDGVKFMTVILRGADFTEATLGDVSFQGVDLTGTKFPDAKHLGGVSWLGGTICPDGTVIKQAVGSCSTHLIKPQTP